MKYIRLRPVEYRGIFITESFYYQWNKLIGGWFIYNKKLYYRNNVYPMEMPNKDILKHFKRQIIKVRIK